MSQRSSIRRQLFTLLIPCVFGLWITSALISSFLVSSYTREVFDRDLVNSQDSVVARIKAKHGRIYVDLPPVALAILRHDQSDRIYYRVLDASGQFICGDSDMPAPSISLPVDTAQVRTGNIGGKEIRISEIKVPVEDLENEFAIVQVAETTNSRKLFQDRMLLSIAVPQFIVLSMAVAAVWYGIRRILTPLNSIQSELARRPQGDLSPLATKTIPEEIFPLVSSINQLFERSKRELKAQQRFIANAAHQLRTPLAGLKTYSSIGTDMTEASELKQIVKDLDHGIDRASRMITQLLTLARTDAGDSAIATVKSPVDLNSIVSDLAAEMIDQAIRREVHLYFHPSTEPATITGDAAALRHLAANLIENAIIYSPHHGCVDVAVEIGEFIRLKVKDNGPGIAEEEREKIFERFYRAPGNIGIGSGLGLSIVQEVANSHYAEIMILHNGERGCEFVVQFPRL